MRHGRGSVGKPAEGRSSGFVGPVVQRFAWARHRIVPLGVGAVALAVAAACATVGSPLPTDARPLLPMPTTPAPSSSSPPSCAKVDLLSKAVPRMDPMPTPGGSMPTGSAMADIKQRGFLKVGIAVDDPPLGSVDWRKLQITGFDADVAHAVADAIFIPGENTVQFQPVSIDQRESVLTSGKVDIVAANYTITCERAQHVNFSGVYYTSRLGLLVRKNAGFSSIGDLQGHTVCTSNGSTSFEKLKNLPPPAPTVTPAPNIADCLVSLQRGEVDAIATDDVILAGIAAQDPLLTVVPHAFDQAFADRKVLDEPYGIGIPKSTPDNSQFVAFVNGVLKAYMSDGRWTASYQQWLSMLGPAPPSPLEEYPPWSR